MLRIARGLRLRVEHRSFSHKTEFTKKIDLKWGSKVIQRGHSVATSVVSDDSKVKKAGKRVTKDERRAMVETYVMKFKAMNNGKFPNTSNTQKEVGGSFYVIKSILQEMEYRSKSSPINPMHENAIAKETTDPDRPSADVAEVSRTVAVDDVISNNSDVKSVGAEEVAAEEEPKALTSLKKTLAEEVVKPNSTFQYEPEAESEEVVAHLYSIKRELDMKDSLQSKGPPPEMQLHKPSSESDKNAIGNSEKHAEEEEVPKQQSVWRNLRSLADGIMKIWRGS